MNTIEKKVGISEKKSKKDRMKDIMKEVEQWQKR